MRDLIMRGSSTDLILGVLPNDISSSPLRLPIQGTTLRLLRYTWLVGCYIFD